MKKTSAQQEGKKEEVAFPVIREAPTPEQVLAAFDVLLEQDRKQTQAENHLKEMATFITSAGTGMPWGTSRVGIYKDPDGKVHIIDLDKSSITVSPVFFLAIRYDGFHIMARTQKGMYVEDQIDIKEDKEAQDVLSYVLLYGVQDIIAQKVSATEKMLSYISRLQPVTDLLKVFLDKHPELSSSSKDEDGEDDEEEDDDE